MLFRSASASAGPVQATFAGVPGQRVAYLATFQTTDVFGRASAPANMWVVVDGVNTENFTLNLQYRQLGDDGATVSLNPVVLPGNGLNTQLEIHQDGYANAYILNSAGQASVTVPVPEKIRLPPSGMTTIG